MKTAWLVIKVIALFAIATAAIYTDVKSEMALTETSRNHIYDVSLKGGANEGF